MSETNFGVGGAPVGVAIAGTLLKPNLGPITVPSPADFPIGTPLTFGYVPASTNTDIVIGLAASAGVTGQPVTVISSGPLTLTAAQVQAVSPDSGPHDGFLVNAVYFLSQTGAKIQWASPDSSPPTGPLVIVGYAISRTTLIVSIQPLALGDSTLAGYGTTGAQNNSENRPNFVAPLSVQGYGLPGNTADGYGSYTNEIAQLFAGEDGLPGVVVRVNPSDGNVYRAQSNTLPNADAIGLAPNGLAIGSAQRVKLISGGFVALTAAQWNAIAGGSGGLTIGTYYLSAATPGFLTPTPPIGGVDYVIKIGRAISPTVFLVQIGDAILSSPS